MSVSASPAFQMNPRIGSCGLSAEQVPPARYCGYLAQGKSEKRMCSSDRHRLHINTDSKDGGRRVGDAQMNRQKRRVRVEWPDGERLVGGQSRMWS